MSIKTERLLSRAKKLIKKGEIKEAHQIYENILKSSPNNSEAKKGIFSLDQKVDLRPSKFQLDSILSLYSLGQYNEAISTLKTLIDNYPDDSLLYNIYGVCLNEIDQTKAAITKFQQAIVLNSNYAEAHYNLGVVYQKIHHNDQALESYKSALISEHAYPTAHNNSGVIYLEKDNINSAVKSFEWAIAYNPNYSEAYNNLGTALQKINRFEEAKKQFEKAVSINPEYAQALENLAILCGIINLPGEALSNFEKAISINPKLTNSYRNLSKLKKFQQTDPLITEMELLHSNNNLSISDKVNISFSLAKVYEDLDNPDNFFKFLNEANELRKQVLRYDITQSENFHSAIVNLFKTSQPVLSESTDKFSNIQPIFIVGMPRSGTSLVEQIISSHHTVHGAGELLTLRKIIDPILSNHLNNGKSKIPKKELSLIREKYLDSLLNLNVSEKIITDKMPVNFRLIGFILSAIPNAKIIHLKRDARATCWSNYKHYFSSGNGFSFSQEDLVKFYVLYTEMMEFWHELFPKKIYDLSYEELTKNQKKETQKLLNYCELDWDEGCLNFHKNTRGVVTASSSQVRQKMYQGSSEAWKKFESNLKPIIEGLKSY
jgi:tetratricopeptide (TPR) repeat protein